MTRAENIIQHLEANVEMRRLHMSTHTGIVYAGIEDLVLQKGQAFNPIRSPEPFPRMEIKQCFCNAATLACENPDLTYVEGYALRIIPVLHAWCLDKNGMIVDPTWKDLGQEYMGIRFDTQHVMLTITEKGTYGVLDNWEQDFPLLRGKMDGVIV